MSPNGRRRATGATERAAGPGLAGWLALVCLVLGLCLAPKAMAAPLCDPGIQSWVARCAQLQELSLEIVTCHRGVVVVRAPAAELEVELRSRSERSFRSAGDIGLSPVGQFSDWSREREARRAALDALTKCAEVDPALPLALTGVGQEARALRPFRPPWLFLGAVAALALTWLAHRGRASREARLALLLGVVTGVLRWLAIPGSFFHQNGQGPAWVAYALRDDVGLAAYGPGFAELFGAPARLFVSDPERGVWLAQSLLAASLPPCAWLIARRLGAKPALAAALAIACAMDPLLGRLASSESYYSAIISLVMLACAASAAAAPRLDTRTFWLPVIAAGFFVAQSVRLHPSAWPAALMVPLPLLLGPGSLHRRSTLFGAGLAAILLVVIASSGRQIIEVAGGALGQKWLPHVSPRWELLAQKPTAYLLAGALALGALLRSWRGFVVAISGVGAIAGARLTDVLSDPNPALTAAHQRLFLPAAIVLVAVLGSRLARARRTQSLVAVSLVVVTLILLPTRLGQLRLPTDALEARFVRELRSQLEATARVAYLERAGSQVTVLPLYAGLTAEPAPLRDDGAPFDLRALPQPAYYFRSSLCETPLGAPVCAALESGVTLEPVRDRSLPALPSMRWNAYASSEVRVALYRIRR